MVVTAVRRSAVLMLVLAVAAALLAATPATADTADGSADAGEGGSGLQPPTMLHAAQDEPILRDLTSACPSDRVPGGDFTDTGPPFEDDIDCLLWYGITVGTTDTEFDTNDPVTRGQMARFLYRLLTHNYPGEALPGENADHDFTDVPDRTDAELERALNSLSSDELADYLDLDGPLLRGHDDGSYRLGTGLERAQMASFLKRTRDGLLTLHHGELSREGFCTFTDTSAIPEAHRDSVSAVCGSGIAQGREDGSFGPRDTVLRGQMAAFIMRTQDIYADDPFNAVLPDQDVEVVDGVTCDPDDADGTHDSPWCTIQNGVDAASGDTTRVTVVSGASYEENVDLGSGGIEVVGVPLRSEETDEFIFPEIVGTVEGDGNGEDLMISRLVLLVPDGQTGLTVTDAATVRLTTLGIATDVEGAYVAADQVHAAGVQVVDGPESGLVIGLWFDVDDGDVIRSDLSGTPGTMEAHIVDEGGNLDLGAFLEHEAPDINSFVPSPEVVDDFDGQYDAIVPAS